MGPCSRCRPACRPAGSSSSRRARWRSGSPASRSCPSAPSIHATRGSLVHRALELAYMPPGRRTRARAVRRRRSTTARDEYRAASRLHRPGPRRRARSRCSTQECRDLVDDLPHDGGPDDASSRSASSCGSAPTSGRSPCAGSSTASSCATASWSSPTTRPGRAPSVNWEQKSLAGVHFYSFLCEQVFGRRPVAIRLMYLSSGETIEATPSEQSVRFITTRTTAVWKAVERACDDRRLQAPPERPVRLVQLPAVVPELRRRSRAGRGRGAAGPTPPSPPRDAAPVAAGCP